MHKKMAHPYEIQNTSCNNNFIYKYVSKCVFKYVYS